MKTLLMVLIVLAAAAAVTVPMASLVDRGPFERAVIGSEAAYWNAARELRGEEVPPRQSAVAPWYPRLLSPMASGELTAVRKARRWSTWVVLPLLSILVWLLVEHRAGRRTALLAATALPLAAPLVSSAGVFTPGIPALLLLLMTLVVLERISGSWKWLVAGALGALALRFHPLAGWPLVLLAFGASLVVKETGGRVWRAGGFLAGLFLFLALGGPLAGAGSLVPQVTGIDVYRGHRSGASGVVPRRGDRDEKRWWTLLDYVREASRRKDRLLSVGEAGRYWGGQGLIEVVKAPHREARRSGTKLLATYQADPLPRDVSTAFLIDRAEKPGLRTALWVGRLLLPLGLAGLLLARRRIGWVIALGLLTGLVASLWTFADEDIRLLGLCMLIGGVAFFIDEMRRRSRRGRAIGLGVGLACLGIWGGLPGMAGAVPGLGIQGDDYFILGALYEAEARGSSAVREYERALRMDPENPYPRLAIAGMLLRDNVPGEAIKELEVLRESHPDFVPGLTALTRAYQDQERWREASAVYGELIRLESWNAEHWNNLATIYVQMALYEQAETALVRALELSPDYATASENLQALRERGLVRGTPAGADSMRVAQEEILDFIRAGNYATAEAALVRAYGRFGRAANLVFIEGTMELVRGNYRKSVELLESVRTSMSKDPFFLNNLGTAYSQLGQYEKAKAAYEEGLALQPSNIRIQEGLRTVQAALDSLGRIGG